MRVISQEERKSPRRRAMERCEARAPRDGARRPWRLTDRQLRHIVRRAGQARAAGDRAVQLHGVVILLRQPGRRRHGCWQQRRSSSAVADDAPTASSAKPEQLSKRKQRSSMRHSIFCQCEQRPTRITLHAHTVAPVWRAELSCPGWDGCARGPPVGVLRSAAAPAGRVPVLGRFHHRRTPCLCAGFGGPASRYCGAVTRRCV